MTQAHTTGQERALREALKDIAKGVFVDAATQVHYSWIDGTNGRAPDFGEAASDYAESFADAYVEMIGAALPHQPAAGEGDFASCPFCESDTCQTAEVRHGPFDLKWAVVCVRGCEMHGPVADDERGAIDAWNARGHRTSGLLGAGRTVRPADLGDAGNAGDIAATGKRDCASSPDGKHQVDTSMESGPNNCFHCERPMKGNG